MKPTIRREELARIWNVAAADQEGSLLVVGEPGSGKTRLLNDVGAIPGVVTYRARINAAEAGLPLSGLSAIVASFQSPDAVALSGKLLLPADGPSHLAARAAELLALIHDFTHPATLLLIDDLDRMDPASQTVFAMVAARLGGTGLRLVGTVAAEPSAGPFASWPRLELGHLDFEASLALVTELTGPHADDAVRRMVVAASGGNPHALAHNARLLSEEQLVRAAPIALPFRVAHANSTRSSLATDSDSAEQEFLLARLSCVYLTSEDAIMSESASVRLALEDLLAEGIVLREGRYVRIANPAQRGQVYWSLDTTTRLKLHELAARAEDPTEPGLSAWHRSWADADHLLPGLLLSAAADFTRIGCIWQAVELAERALALESDRVNGAAPLLDLAEAMFQRGELSYAERYARLGQRRPDAASTAPKLGLLRTGIEFMSTQQLPTTDLDDWVSVNSDRDPDGAAYVLAMIALYRLERWEIDSAKESLGRARRLFEQASLETIELRDLALMLMAALEGDHGPANKMFERLSRHGWAEGTSTQALVILGRSLTFADRYFEARGILKSVINQEPSPDPLLRETARYYLAENEILAGNHFEAVAIINQLHAAGPGAQLHRNVHQLLMTWYWQATGNRKAADATISECHRRFAASNNPALAARLVTYQGRFALMDGRFDDAIAFLRSAGTLGTSFKNPALLRHQVDLIEAYVLAGRLREALAQFREFHARSLPFRTRWCMLATARAEALVTPGEPSLGAFQQAVGLWQPGDSQFELGRTLLSYADRLVSLGHNQEGAEQYLAARMIFTQLGAMLWARKADAVRLGHDTTGEHPLLAKLAPDERLVAVLVRQGLRNKEIAAELFVSLRTVEVRLTRIYHKLGARSRSHLTAMLSSTDAVATERVADWTS